jgi:serine/threonine protein phosphatase PrpC
MTTNISQRDGDDLTSCQTIEAYLHAFLELSKSTVIAPPNHHQVLAVLQQLKNLYFPKPAWATALDDVLINWMDLFITDRASFDTLQMQREYFNFNTLYWSGEINPDLTLQYLTPDAPFIQHSGCCARVLTAMLQQGLYIVRFKPEYFVFYNNRLDCSWEALQNDALSEQKRQLNKMEVGWMHGALRNLELPANAQPAAMVTHTFAYSLLYTLTHLPPAQHQGALLEQIDRFRLYNPLLTADLRNFWRHYLQLPITSLETPLDCWQALQTILKRCNNYNATETIPANYDFGGDSVYGRHKRSNDNEDIFFYLAEEGVALLGVADGVSTADLGRGRLASHAIKRVIDDQEFEWRRRLQQLVSVTSDMERQQHIETFIQELFHGCQQAVLTEINACFSRKIQKEEATQPMSSTLVVAVIVGQSVTIGHWGDSRAYKISGEQIIRLTEDHNRRNELLIKTADTIFELLPKGAGAELSRVVGQCRFDQEQQCYVNDAQKVSIDHCQLAPGDYLLLCSDGLLNIDDVNDEAVAEMALKQQIDTHSNESCRELARQLVRSADDVHGNDNITALLLRLVP